MRALSLMLVVAACSGGPEGGTGGGSGSAGGGAAGGATAGGGAAGGAAGGATAGGGAAGGSAGGGSTDGGSTAMPTGTVTAQYLASCPGSHGPTVQADGGTFHCARVTVSCPNVDDLSGVVALTQGAPGKATIVTHGGATGANFLSGNLPQAWADDGFSIAQIAWDLDWECPRNDGGTCRADTAPVAQRSGLKDAACRPATLLKWIHDQAQLPGGGAFFNGGGYCAHGSSGGSAALWYSLIHYGQSAVLDFVSVGASTPMGRIDIGCDPANATVRRAPACQNFPNAPTVPVAYNANGFNSNQAFDRWFSVSSCTVAPTTDELDLFARNSIVSPGADLNFVTPVTAYDCVDLPTVNVVPALGAYVFDALHANDPTSARYRSQCVVTANGHNGGSNGTCNNEGAFADIPMRQAAIADMETRCVPLAR